MLRADAAGASAGAARPRAPQKCCAACSWLLEQSERAGAAVDVVQFLRTSPFTAQAFVMFSRLLGSAVSDATPPSVARKHGVCQTEGAPAAQIRALLDSAEETGCVSEAECRGAAGEECKVSRQSI